MRTKKKNAPDELQACRCKELKKEQQDRNGWTFFNVEKN
jgi:hypothetical protein